jgi:hypothetical protein
VDDVEQARGFEVAGDAVHMLAQGGAGLLGAPGGEVCPGGLDGD